MGGEIKNARRTIPRALLIGGSDGDVLLHRRHDRRAGGAAVDGSRQPAGTGAGRSQDGRACRLRSRFPLAAFLIALSNVGAAAAYLAAVARLPFVAGIDHFLPPAFGSASSALENAVGRAAHSVSSVGALFIFLGQAGTSIKGAYDVLVSMGVITYFIPYLYLFAAMFKLQNEPAGPEVIRVPGGKPVARLVVIVGFATTTVTIGLSLMPPPDDPNKLLAVIKIVGLSAALVLIGAWIYWAGKKRGTVVLRSAGVSPAVWRASRPPIGPAGGRRY